MYFSLNKFPTAFQILFIFKVNIALGSILPNYSEFPSLLSAFFSFNLNLPIKREK